MKVVIQDRVWRSFFLKHKYSLYKWGSLSVLLATTLYWSLLGALQQQGNADQLVDGFLFAHLNTFKNALFPSSHTLLIKWPLFLFLGISHNCQAPYIINTQSKPVSL
jgi:hypothetical protein